MNPQGDMAPVTAPTKSDIEFGQLIRQTFSRYHLPIVEINTDVFGPYTPNFVPTWVLKMMRRDFVIALGMKALKAPLIRASRYAMRGGDPEARAFHMKWLKPLLPKLLRTSLNALDFGFQAHELVFDESLPTIRFEVSGKKKQLRRAIILKKIVDLDPDQVEILSDPKTKMFAGLEVNETVGVPVYTGVEGFVNSANAQFIPPHKTFLVSYEHEFGNLRGRPLQLPAYNPWWWSNVGYQFWGRFMERLGSGVYLGVAPAESRIDSNGNRVYPTEFLNSQLMALRALGVISIPFEPCPTTQENKWKVELLESKNDGTAFEKWQVHLSACKLRGILIPDRLVLQDGTGSFAAHESTFNQWFAFLESLVDELILNPINQQIIEPVHRYNYGDDVPCPQLGSTPMDPAMKKIFMEIFKVVANLPRSIESPKKDAQEAPGKPAPKKEGKAEMAFPPMPMQGKMPMQDPAAKPQESSKRVDNAALVDALTLLEMLDVPVRPESEWPETDPMEETKLKISAAPASRDMTKSDTEKNGDKKPTDERR